MTDRISLVPDNFENWPEDAQRAFLEDGRKNHEVLLMICQELGIEDEVDLGETARIQSTDLVDILMAVQAKKDDMHVNYPEATNAIADD